MHRADKVSDGKNLDKEKKHLISAVRMNGYSTQTLSRALEQRYRSRSNLHPGRNEIYGNYSVLKKKVQQNISADYYKNILSKLVLPAAGKPRIHFDT